ncbi:phage portal protein [Candidatus Magnetaquicoccus inordinatus]|uniref:phage portal protein n=1 Tax=Candidatus Magnetaquicoccus inordinatus TaxID=2496818 RepID=UPI00102D2721|nr:phage portal protein [Candidatus Magnetaquicoccus inordinatus]
MWIADKVKSLFFGASAERSPVSDFWYMPSFFRSVSGVPVTAETAMQLSTVFACVRILAETMASMPFQLKRRRADRGFDLVTDHWVYRILSRRPNNWQTPFEFREMLMGHLTLRGNAYAFLDTDFRGNVVAMIPLHPDRVRLEVMQSGDFRYQVSFPDGTNEIVHRDQIWHLRGLSSDGYRGLSPIELAADNLGAALATQRYSGRFWQNDGKPTGGWIEFPGTIPEAQRAQHREEIQRHISGANRHKIMLLDRGLKYHEVGVSNKDAQFLEVRQFQVVEIARLFRVPPHMLADLSKASFSNIEQQSLDFLIHTMRPWLERWESSIETEFLIDEPGGESLEAEFDFSNLLRGDAASRMAFNQSAIFAGWKSVNEVRVDEGLNPLPGAEFDEPRQPMNMGPAGIGQTEKDAASGTTKVKQARKKREKIIAGKPEMEILAVDEVDEYVPMALESIAMAVIARVARKEVLAMRKAIESGKSLDESVELTYRSHARYVSESMAVGMEMAEGYCEVMKSFLLTGGTSAVSWLEDQSIRLLSKMGGINP